jgi:hypothetical protein
MCYLCSIQIQLYEPHPVRDIVPLAHRRGMQYLSVKRLLKSSKFQHRSLQWKVAVLKRK